MRTQLIAISVLSILITSTLPLVNADGGQEQPSEYAFLPSWNGNLASDLDPTGESVLNGLEFSNHAFDNEGNLYYAESEDSGSWMNGEYSFNYQRGIHILKIDTDNQVEYSEVISCSNYCNYADYAYSKVISINVVDEDQFYITLSTYYIYLTFDGVQYGSNQNNLYTAFYDSGTWSWVDVEPTPSYGYSSIQHIELDDSGNLYRVTLDDTSGSWSDYSISSFSPTGTNWVRTFELPYQNPTYNYIPSLYDVDDDGGFHGMFTIPNQMKYDSQTISCPTSGENGFCHLWLSIDENGVKTSAVGSPYTSIRFKRMIVQNDSVYLSGDTYDYVVNSHTESNFTGQKISHSPRKAQYLAVMESDGSWGYHLAVNKLESYWQYGALIDVTTEGNMIYHSIYNEPVSIDGTMVTNNSNADIEAIVLSIHPEDGLDWFRSVGFTNANTLPLTMKTDGLTIAFMVTDPYNGQLFFDYNGDLDWTSSTSSTGNYIFWIETEGGEIVDVESTAASMVYSRSPGGGVLAGYNSNIYYYMPDYDGDNIGTEDNCPDVFNPDQSDYNANGLGDACDEDDDSDGVLDFNDLCPRGTTGWLSDSINDFDGDGCKDAEEEDNDDDNDGVPDFRDSCQYGIGGALNDLDGDGCKDSEDDDDDGDLVRDESDLCVDGVIDWSSGTLTDHDGDGCKDDDEEDKDDDNDGVADSIDTCPRGATNWPSNINTDFDGDGCKDGFEDEDDDGDGITNVLDSCPDSFGEVNAQGCSASQTLQENGGSNIVYYVCSSGSVVVLDPEDCPDDSSNPTPNDNGNVDDDTFYFVCPGGSDVVTDLSECEGSIVGGTSNLTLVVDPSSNASSDYITCDGGKAIVLDPANCPENIETENVASQDDSVAGGGMMLFFVAGTFVMSTVALLAVLLRKQSPAETSFSSIDSTEKYFKEEPAITKEAPTLPSPPPSKTSVATKPSPDMIGTSHEGKEWIEWPENSGNHFYRELGFGGNWTKYE
jgi:hypothetical protein